MEFNQRCQSKIDKLILEISIMFRQLWKKHNAVFWLWKVISDLFRSLFHTFTRSLIISLPPCRHHQSGASSLRSCWAACVLVILWIIVNSRSPGCVCSPQCKWNYRWCNRTVTENVTRSSRSDKKVCGLVTQHHPHFSLLSFAVFCFF